MPRTASGLPPGAARDGNGRGTPAARGRGTPAAGGHPASPAAAAGPPLLLDQAFGRRDLHALRAAVRAHAIQAGMPGHRADDLTLVVHELAANAVQHGAGHGRLLMWHYDGTLHCRVDDDGPPGRAGQDPACAAPDEAAGWPCAQPHGLWLVRALAEQVTITSGRAGTQAAAAFAPPPPEQSGPR